MLPAVVAGVARSVFFWLAVLAELALSVSVDWEVEVAVVVVLVVFVTAELGLLRERLSDAVAFRA